MKMRIAVVGELQGNSSLAAKAERMLGEITMQLGQKQVKKALSPNLKQK